MCSIDLTQLRSECAALEDIFHEETCFFPEPLALLHTLFGGSGYQFSRDSAFIRLKIHGTGMQYSIVSDEGAGMTPSGLVGLALQQNLSTAEIPPAKKERLARLALQSLPPRRIADILYERSDNRDGVIVRAPFAPVPSRHRHPTLCGKAASPKRSRGAGASEAGKINEFFGVDRADVALEICYMHIAGKALCGHRVVTPKRTSEPIIFCESIELSVEVAVLSALCRT